MIVVLVVSKLEAVVSYEWQLWTDESGERELVDFGTGLTASQLETALAFRCGATEEELDSAMEVTLGPERAAVALWGDSWVEVSRRQDPESW